jgi:hypothetical protein
MRDTGSDVEITFAELVAQEYRLTTHQCER